MPLNESQAIAKMVAPGTRRESKWRAGVIQIWVTRACDKACFGCSQGSNLAGKPGMITPEQFEQACDSLAHYWGVIGVFGGNPATHPQFDVLCEILRKKVPWEQRGLWSNNPLGKGKVMRETFNPAYSNLNCHLDANAFAAFRRDWPESRPFGLHDDSRHSPPFVAMRDVIEDEGKRWELISGCDINRLWSSMLCVVRGKLRAYFCELAGAAAMLHEDDPEWPDLGMNPEPGWWRRPMQDFADQVRFHCHRCGVPLRGYGELSQSTSPTATEQASATHAGVYRPKRKGRPVQVVETLEQLGTKRLARMTDYIRNGKL